MMILRFARIRAQVQSPTPTAEGHTEPTRKQHCKNAPSSPSLATLHIMHHVIHSMLVCNVTVSVAAFRFQGSRSGDACTPGGRE